MNPGNHLTLPENGRDHLQGPEEASIVLLEYGDYECPACGSAYPILKAIEERLGERLCFAFRNFPLTNIHPHAERAAEAAEAAGARGNFWEMHDILFENQGALEDGNLADYAETVGLDEVGLIRDVVAGVYRERVREDFKRGIKGGVNGTPVFFIDGERYDGPLDFDALMAALVRPAPGGS